MLPTDTTFQLPDFAKAFEHENNFYLSCQNMRMGKWIIHYELFKKSLDVEGDIIECGVLKGASLVRFAMFRALADQSAVKKLIGFDTYSEFPETSFEPDIDLRKDFIEDAGIESISVEDLRAVLKNKNCNTGVDLIAGDICQTVPQYVQDHPDLKISLLNLDTDLYESSAVILENFYPKLVKGGVLILDDYQKFLGETKAIEEYFADKKHTIRRFPFQSPPCYIIKEEDAN